MLYRRYLGQSLGHERLEIHEASSGTEGLEQFREQQPDCVLLDYNLLDTDGLSFLEDLKQLAPTEALCVVMITGGGSEALAVRVLNSGALDYLVKGHFDQDLLCKTVRHAIEKNEWRQYVGRYHDELQGINRELRDSLAALTEARQLLHERNAQLSAAHAEVQARNQELHTANQQLARTNADLDNFVYAASHDLKQPVNNLRGLFEELQRSATFHDPDEAQVLRLVEDSLQGLHTTISDLAAVVQEQRQPDAQAAEPLALNDLVADVLQVLGPQQQETQAHIHTNFAALPELEYVRSNLRTILLNLVANALKYHHPDRTPQVHIRTYLLDGRPVLEVQDNGIGINLERHGNELFQLFRRFHPQAGTGTGVGLYLVNRLVQSHGGHIEVESTEGEGTLFRVWLRGETPGMPHAGKHILTSSVVS
jgi:signal transduction histidine kinase